jgi:hypothetical protein
VRRLEEGKAESPKEVFDRWAGVAVERVVNGLKGKPYVMEISIDNTVHQIAFEIQGEFDQAVSIIRCIIR